MNVLRGAVATLALLLAFSLSAIAGPVERSHRTTFKIDTGIGTCTATAVGPHTLLTADHCVHNEGLRRIDMGGTVADVVSIVSDGQDHVLIRVDHRFKSWALVRRAPMRQGDVVHMYGNPGNLLDVYRRGYFSGWANLELTHPDFPQRLWAQRGMLFDFPVGGGDSGSGIFDERGLIVTALSGEYTDRVKLTFCLPLAFTAAQWKEAAQ